MTRHPWFAIFLLLGLICSSSLSAQNKGPRKFDLQHADLLEVILGEKQDTTIALGSVAFQTESGTIICDSAVWIKGRRVKLVGSVIVEDTAYRLIADTVNYDLRNGTAVATGTYVELFSRQDSLFAVGRHAFYDRPGRYFRMEQRPTLYFNYPDSSRMIEVISDQFDYDADDSLARAEGNVVITSQKVAASAGRAEMSANGDQLDLYDKPVLKRGESTVQGRFISILSENDVLRQIIVNDSARAEFQEPTNEGPKPEYDQSILTGKDIVFDFDYGQLQKVTSTGQAYSWYYPAARGSGETSENAVSGDTITFDLEYEKLQVVTVIGGATGSYINTKIAQKDTVVTTTRDTVDYTSQHISYDMEDSTITLVVGSHVSSADVELDAHRIVFDTEARIIRAYSANVVSDSAQADSTFTARFHPNPIPVILKDKAEELYGDFLEYSIDTQKGRIVQSKSQYETGYYYGQNVYRAQENVFYVVNGRYTTCDAEEPHFHFYSKNMKMVQDDKLIARPVVLNLGRLPILALPYYVFPLKKGRHSGILPFRIGNLEQGNRYLQDFGYYWAPSDFWDAQASMSYYDGRDAITFSSQFRYKKLYVFDGGVSGNLTRETGYNSGVGSETKTTRWTLNASHNHEFSPTFKMSGTGQFVSDKTYYENYSADLRDRLNDNIVSRINLSKRFSKQIALAGAFSHTVYLDEEARVDKLENVGLSLPTIKPFGSGSANAEGQIETRWYQSLTVRPTTRANFLSERRTRDSILIVDADTTIETDTAGIPDTTITILDADSSTYRTRRKFASADHGLSIDMPLTVARFIRLNPSFTYNESWVYLFRTDQTELRGLEPTGYRSYMYRAGASLATSLYGTVYPNIFGLIGLRQVLTPTLSYGYTPKISQHPAIRTFTGVGQGTERSSSAISMSLDQLYQAKFKSGEEGKNLDLLHISSSVSYDFENNVRPWSALTTNFQSSVVPKINLNGSMSHDLYRPGTNDVNLFSPYLTSFQVNASASISGTRFLFDSDEETPGLSKGADSADQVTGAPKLNVGQSKVSQGWNVTLDYSYGESGRGKSFTKSSQLRFSLRFNLSPTTTFSYSQYYDIARGTAVNRQINIAKQLHCWTGQIYWVPVGSNKGYGFQLFVTAIPALKIDNSETGAVAGNLMQNLP